MPKRVIQDFNSRGNRDAGQLRTVFKGILNASKTFIQCYARESFAISESICSDAIQPRTSRERLQFLAILESGTLKVLTAVGKLKLANAATGKGIILDSFERTALSECYCA